MENEKQNDALYEDFLDQASLAYRSALEAFKADANALLSERGVTAHTMDLARFFRNGLKEAVARAVDGMLPAAVEAFTAVLTAATPETPPPEAEGKAEAPASGYATYNPNGNPFTETRPPAIGYRLNFSRPKMIRGKYTPYPPRLNEDGSLDLCAISDRSHLPRILTGVCLNIPDGHIGLVLPHPRLVRRGVSFRKMPPLLPEVTEEITVALDGLRVDDMGFPRIDEDFFMGPIARVVAIPFAFSSLYEIKA